MTLKAVAGPGELEINDEFAKGLGFEHFRQMASDILVSSSVQAAFNLDLEPLRLRQAYGEHLCGQSLLMARRLTEAGVPRATRRSKIDDPVARQEVDVLTGILHEEWSRLHVDFRRPPTESVADHGGHVSE